MQLTKVQGGFIPGERRRPLGVPRAPHALPLICYEIIFPGQAVPRDGERPGWLLNLTNDGWFGNSTGPYQHFQQARVRAIEEGLPLVRAANTGISAVVDPLGRIVKQLPLGAEGVLDAPLPRPVAPHAVRARRRQPGRPHACGGRCTGHPSARAAKVVRSLHAVRQGWYDQTAAIHNCHKLG